MNTEMSYVVYFGIGVVVIATTLYLLNRKKGSDTTTQSDKITTSLRKRLQYNKILLYIFGAYRLLVILFSVIRGKENEQEFYTRFVIEGTIFSIPFIIIGFLAVISAVVGIFLSLIYIRKEKDIAKKLLPVSIGLLAISFFWKYIISFAIMLVY